MVPAAHVCARCPRREGPERPRAPCDDEAGHAPRPLWRHLAQSPAVEIKGYARACSIHFGYIML